MATQTQSKTQKDRTRKQQEATASTLGLAQMEMHDRWDTITDLLGGTKEIRRLREKHLPREPNEEPDDYNVRLKRTFLFEALKDTIDKVSAKPFEQPVAVDEESLTEVLTSVVQDADRCGTSLNSQAKVVFKDGVARGIMHVIVDMPHNPDRKVTVTARPSIEHVAAADIIAVKTEYDEESGARVLSNLRYWVTKTEQLGEFGETEVRFIKEWTRTEWRTHMPSEDGREMIAGDWNEHSFRAGKGGGIPLVTKYLEKDGEFLAQPPFSKLADLNVEHLQKSSDHTNLGRFAAVGVLALFGFEVVDENGNRVEFNWGPRNTLRSENPNARAEILEHSGSALNTLAEGIKQVEERMEGLGLEPFQRRSGSETATGKALHAGKSDSAIKDWVRELEALYLDAFKLAAEWLASSDVTIPDDFRVKFFSDFEAPVLKGADDTAHLLAVRGRQEISGETFLEELRRRGILSEEVAYDREKERLENETPAMPPPSDTDLGDDDDDESEAPIDGELETANG